MISYVFKRYELKYLLSMEQYRFIKDAISKSSTPDEYGKTTIQSLYLDTENDRLVRQSIEKPVYKEKLRLRCYNLNLDNKDIYVEMKRKYDGVVYKRRIACKEGDVEDVLLGRMKKSQIGRELNYFLSFYSEGLRGKILILYDREAFFDEKDDLRITFDQNLRYRCNHLNFHTSLEGNRLLDKDFILMELKTGTALPIWLLRKMESIGIKKTSFSKYGRAYEIEFEKKKGDKQSCLRQFSTLETSLPSVSLSH